MARADGAGARWLFTRIGGAGNKLRRIWVEGAYPGKRVEWVVDHGWFILRAADLTGVAALPQR